MTPDRNARVLDGTGKRDFPPFQTQGPFVLTPVDPSPVFDPVGTLWVRLTVSGTLPEPTQRAAEKREDILLLYLLGRGPRPAGSCEGVSTTVAGPSGPTVPRRTGKVYDRVTVHRSSSDKWFEVGRVGSGTPGSLSRSDRVREGSRVHEGSKEVSGRQGRFRTLSVLSESVEVASDTGDVPRGDGPPPGFLTGPDTL